MKNALLVPCVFFLSFLTAVLVFSFFGGLAVHYELTAFNSASPIFLLLCMAQSCCVMLPIAAMAAVIGVYAFLMRYRTKLMVAVSLLFVCLIFTITVIMPVCYAQVASIEGAMAKLQPLPAADKAVAAFLNKPFVLMVLMQAVNTLFSTLYSVYTADFLAYLIFAAAFFFYTSSFWIACIATRWNMLNLLLLFLLTGGFLFLYPYMQQEMFQSVLFNLHLDLERNKLGIPLTLCVAALILHTAGGLKVLLNSVKNKKRRAS